MLNPKPKRDYSELFWNIPVALYRTTPQGNLVDANPAMVALLGYDIGLCTTETNTEKSESV
ncbi:MAG: hypothetical protein HN413_03430, partial [Chloroflexi bacterium]|nr:hypothetical protein [Chloroflexota bacterium]